MFIFLCGEPLVRKKDIIKLCEKHTDCYFLAFTNGTLIDEAFADDMLRVGNFAPAISVASFAVSFSNPAFSAATPLAAAGKDAVEVCSCVRPAAT